MELIKKINEKISKPLILAFFILLLGGTITYYQNRINSIEIPEKTKVVVASTNIRRGEEIKGSSLKEKIIYAEDQHPQGIKDMSQMIGKIAVANIIEGREIVPPEIVAKSEWGKEEERYVGITFNHFTDIVGGSGVPGDMVDIMLSYDEKMEGGLLREPEVVLKGIELRDVYNDNNTSYKETKDKLNFKPITVLVRITEEEEKALDLAKKKGRIYARRYTNQMKIQEETTSETSEVIIIGGE